MPLDLLMPTGLLIGHTYAWTNRAFGCHKGEGILFGDCGRATDPGVGAPCDFRRVDPMAELSSSARRVRDALARKGLHCNVLEMPKTTRTAQDAAAAIGCSVEQIAKCLIFKTSRTGRPILVIASGPNRVHEKR